MLLPLNWLREFVPYEGDAETLGDRLTMLGLELEELIHPFAGIKDIVVGHVVECGPHPDSDHLSVTRVDIGSEVLDIVCGAPNVAKGQKVPVAPVGVTLPGGLVIKKTKLRGAPSNGMICSERELGLTDDHSGIWVLDEALQPGTRLVDALNLETDVLDIGITPNRGDCLSVLGLAREAALAFDLPLSLTPLSFTETATKAADAVSIQVEDGVRCPVYMARVLENVAISKSPDWLRFRLIAAGMRPISNIVDVTNYIMLGYGQPLHAFDLDTVRGRRIIVRCAADGESFATLDGQERTLTARDLTIRDTERAIALAGVMGGLETEITDASTRVLLECAIFQPRTVRHTARRLGIPSESSYRYERGVDQGLAPFALDQAAALMAALGGSGVAIYEGVSKEEPRPWKSEPARFRTARCNQLLGREMDSAFCRKTLEKLGCRVDAAKKDEWTVFPPSHRPDLTREADMIEEVARVFGVDRFEPTLPAIPHSLERAGAPETEFAFWRRIRRWGAGLGLNEVINYSFTGNADLDRLNLPKENRIRIMNPLSSERDVMRTELVPGMLSALRNGLAQGRWGLRLFELAHVFHADGASETTAREPGRISFLLYGERFDSAWPHTPGIMDYPDLKGVVEHFLDFLHLKNARFIADESPHPWLRPSVTIRIGDTVVGVMGRVLPEIADTAHARHDVWTAELDLNALRILHDSVKVAFSPLPVYPPVRRDITFAGPYALPAGDVLEAIRAMNLPLLEETHLHDVYAPDDEDVRRLTFRMTFRHGRRPLEDAEVDKQRDAIAKHLTETLPVPL
ncbi:MAG: phenylalanine--tRNA ligase subunit beta [Deltaproteobacteria bacterium]|nr:phenylalanine--tRNA ligase subunit beta [Deltaproteobacteria bacterium]